MLGEVQKWRNAMSKATTQPQPRGRPSLPAECRLVHTGIRLGTKDRSQLRLLARSEGISVSEYLRRLVWAHIATKST